MPLDEDRFVAPLPILILTRVSEGIYHQMFSQYRTEFSSYFGHLFEAYVGTILRNSFPISSVLSEQEIRKTYKSRSGKVPDWIIMEDTTAILIECKATGFSRKALATGDRSAIEYSIDQVVKGLVQLHEFRMLAKQRLRA